MQGVGRFRVNAFRQRGSVSLVMRFILFGVPRFDDLGLPGVIGTPAREERGIILVTGTTGSGPWISSGDKRKSLSPLTRLIWWVRSKIM